MKIRDILQAEKPVLSFEVFPPKATTPAPESIVRAVEAIAALKPPFMSVTCGAGGTTVGFTNRIAAHIQNDLNVPSVAHLTCVGTKREDIRAQLEELRGLGIENIFALRGDMPAGMSPAALDFKHATDLVREIREAGDFCIGCAAYPEGHPESPSQKEDIRFLAEKVAAGCDFLTTQMFFDNNILYNFLYKVRDAGIRVPVIAGIMPVTNAKQIGRIVQLGGNMVPPRFLRIVDRFGDSPEAMKQAGIAFATEQIIDLLANGVNAVHVYSMNKPDVAATILHNLSEILK
ncbi:MAG: methylenetetrahydrofolate reductase [NAD(P)H] [Ruminococcaceae bacterium]|nr:methylenetetrahydrofolate reductase [NAD(P)H] [Oscillospiraceae bacterium]